MVDDVKVWENKGWEFYRTDMTEIYTRRMNGYDPRGLTLPDRMTVYKCVPKDGSESIYVAFDPKGKPYMEFTDPWDLDFRLATLMMKFKEETDIVNMAKKRCERDVED